MYLKFIFLTVLDFGYLYHFAKFQRLWVPAQRMPLKQLFQSNKIQNKFILYFKQNSFLLRMGWIKFYCDTSVTIHSNQALVKYENNPPIMVLFLRSIPFMINYRLFTG